VLAAASAIVASTGHKVGIVWSLVYELISDFGFANLFPIGLAGVMVGAYFLHLAATNLFVGRLASCPASLPETGRPGPAAHGRDCEFADVAGS
jgi:hypothetical protein